MKKLIGSISVALTLALSVFGLAACDLVNFNWGTGSDHEHHFTEYEATDPTCTKNGNYRYFKCDVGPDPCGRYYLDLAAMEPVSEESVMIPALGHEYDFTNIVWSEWNGKEITASVTCTQCDEEEPGHVLNPKITVEFTQTKAPTCTAKGEGYYTASFTYEGETYTNPTTNAAEVDMIPHTYNKVPDDGWKWADGHTSVSATFTCTAADCTHTETVTVSGAAITSKVETIKGVCTDGSQTVYTATAEFNGETYDLTDTVVTRAAINEHKVGDWQYDATQHWHKCSVCGEDMDDKASHQPDSSTHKCECGYEEESYTVTAASINAADGKVVLTINGTCTGYTQETLAAAFKTFGFYGGGWTYPASEDFTLTLTEKAWTITVDVTKMENKSYSVCLESESGYGDIKPTFEVTGSAELNNKTYTLSKNGDGNLTLTIADKAVEKTYAITDASIAAEGEAVYVTVSGTFAGYSAEEFLAALQDDKTGRDELAFCVFYDGTGPSDSKWGRVIPYNSKLIEYDAKEGGTFTVKINVTSLEKNLYKIGKDNGNYADITNLSCTGTATVGDKKYDLAGNTGGLALVVSDKPDESKARDLTGISLTAEGGRVYLVYTGTFKGYSEGEMTTYLTDEEIFYFWGNGGARGQKPASRAATFENGKWTLKLDVTDMPDDTEYALCWKDYTGNDLKPPLAGGSDTVQDAGNRTYTLIAKAWNDTVRLKIRTNVSFTVTKGEIAIEGGKTVVTISGTYSNCTKAQFEAVLKDTDETNVGFRVINGGNIIDGKKNWDKVAGPTSYEVGDDNTFTVKIDVTDLAAGKIDDSTAGNYYVNQETGDNSDIKSLTEKYEKSITNGTKTYKLTGTPGENIALFIKDAPAPAKTATFGIANLQNDGGVRVLLRITATGFEADDLKPENIELSIDETNKVNAYLKTGDNEYYFYVKDFTTGGNLKVTIGGVEFTKNLASEVAADQNKQFVNPNFYTLALNGDDLVLTVYNAAEAFTLNGISLKNTEGTVNLTLTGTTTAADATAKLFLENYGYCYYKNGRQQFANKTVTVEDGAFTFTVDVTDLGAGSYTLLARDADGTDLKNGELVTDREVQIENMKYSITTNGTVVLVIEDSAHACDYTSITLEKTGEQVYLVLGGTYDGYSKEEVEALLKNTNPGENYSLGFYPNVIPAEDRTITVNDSEKTWTLKFEITDLNAGAHNFCIQMVGGGDAKGPAGFVQQTETVGDTTFTLQGGVGANISVKVEKKDPDAQTGTVAYTSVTLEPTAEKVYLVYRGTYTGFTAEYLKETVLKNTDTSKEDIPSFGFYKGGFNKAMPAEITVTEEGLTWEVKIDITDFSGEYSVLWRNIGGGDAKGPADFVAQSEAFNGNTYSLTGSVGGDIHLKVEEGIHGTYEVTSGSVELEGGKAYFSVNGTYKNYEEDGLKAALETVEFWFTRYGGDWPEIGQGTSEKRTPFTTEPEISVDTEAKTWKVSVDVTNFENGTWIAKFPGDIKLAGSKDGQSVTVGTKNYSIFNKYPDGSEQPSIWGCTCLLVEDALKENEINFGGESVSTVHPDHMFYWNGDTEGTNATVTTKTAVDGVYTFQYTLTETAKGNAGLWYAVQLFYKNSELKENTVYTLTFQLKSSVTGKITVNGTVIDLTGSNQVQAVSVEYTQNAKASLSIQFGVYGNAPLEGGTFVISELKWQEKTSGPEEPPAEKSVTFAGTDFMMYGDKDIQLALNLASIQGYDKETDLAVSNIKLIVGTLEIPCREYPGAIYFTLTTAGTSIADLADESYEVKLKIGTDVYVCPTNLQGQIGQQLSLNGKTYTLAVVDGKLILTVATSTTPVDKEINFTVVSINADNGNLRIFFNYTKQGYSEGELTKDNFKLYVGEKEIDCSELAADAMHFVFAVDDLSDSSYTVVIKLNGEEVAFGTMTVNSALTSIELNGKTFTLATTGDTDKKLTLTVAAVAPAADGSQDAPFSVSDLAAIFEDDSQFGTFSGQSYYTGGGSEPQKVYVGGYIKDIGSTNDYGFTQIVIEPTQAAAAGIALAANELNEILIYSANYSDIANKGMTLKVGDYIVVYGYLEIFSGTTKEIASYNKDYPTIESFRSVTPEEDAEAAFQEINGKTFTVSSTLPLPTFTTRPGVTYKFEVQSEGSENLKINEQDGVFEVLKRSKEQDLTITVNVTISVAGQEGTKSTTITVTIPKDTGEESVTYKASDTPAETTNGTKVEEVSLNEAVTLTFGKGKNSSNSPVYYGVHKDNQVSDSPVIRCYPQNTITLSGQNGATILSVTIVFGVKTKTDSAPLTETTTKQTVSSGTAFQVGEEGVGASSIEFQVSNVSGQQVHIASIEVTYKPGKTLSPDEKIDAALKEINIEKTEFNDDFVLPTTIVSGVTLTWSVEGGDGVAAKIDETNTKLLIVPQTAEVTFTLVVEASCNGGTPVSKKFENLKVSAKTAVKTYTLVTSEEDLEVGAKIVFVSGTSVCGGFQTGKGRFNPVSGVVISSSTITTLPQDAVIWTVGGESGAWTFSTQGQYMQQTSDAKDKMALVATTSDSNNTQWTLTSATGNTWKIQCKGYTASYFQFSGSYFSSFTSGQKNPSIYVAS